MLGGVAAITAVPILPVAASSGMYGMYAFPSTPTALLLPFKGRIPNVIVRGPRYRIVMDRIVTPRFTEDVNELKTWRMDT